MRDLLTHLVSLHPLLGSTLFPSDPVQLHEIATYQLRSSDHRRPAIMEATRTITASMAALTATPLAVAGSGFMPYQDPRRITEVRRRVDFHNTHADPSRSSRHSRKLSSKEPYAPVQKAAPPNSTHVVRSERVAK